ncbi:MAG: formylglycine-generating enzyme family protein [Planctomycetota bacterium]|nr:formylglycine-generating enzyme family protein [Planctomycetota bacterium]
MRLLAIGLCLVAITWASSARAKDLADGKVAGELWEGNDLRMKFRWCPAGTFMMGSPASEPDRLSDEGPVTVKLTRGFWMSQYEVTQGEWQSLMVTTITDQKTKAGDSDLYGEGSRYPMYYVNHNEAMEFCRKLTDSERSAERLPVGWEYRLPTEAQWEYACRAGTTTATAFGSSLSSTQANFHGEYPYNGAAKGPNLEKTAVVGSYKANAWGLCDMHGNVWEWCRDWYTDTLSGGRDPDVSQPGDDSLRVLRGGGWVSFGRYCRSAFRFRIFPAFRFQDFGFRVAIVRSGS